MKVAPLRKQHSLTLHRAHERMHAPHLGLELAAANVGILPLQEIADAIEKSAEFLTVDWRDMPQRQRSMRAVFTWSWQLLNAQERAVFRQLAIFQGSFTRAAAERIAGATLPLLARLMNKSLVHLTDPTLTEGRYQIHELLRQFATDELANAQEETATAYRHSVYVSLGHHHRAAEPRAGLARLALDGDALAEAMREVEEILTILHNHPLAGFDEPFQVYQTCYTVLTANHDPRAADLITTAHELLITYAERLPDPAVRRAFCENVAIHRKVQQAFVREKGDKMTR